VAKNSVKCERRVRALREFGWRAFVVPTLDAKSASRMGHPDLWWYGLSAAADPSLCS